MNQLAEVSVLVISVCLSWFFLSQVFIYFSKRNVKKLAPATKVHNAKFDSAFEMYTCEDDVPALPDVSKAEEAIVSVFEHYGLFGAPLGAWSVDGARVAPMLVSAASQENTSQERHAGMHPHGSLFEHYGLFGADVGAWSGPCKVESPFDLADVHEQ